ncbi:MAG: hypothetical protein DHS20C18_44980 [Saprospiraceae bacterium]|nr:MAG: hypothetical protein DHS20C18_44980 [Saprospiraceae bacterium]
MERRIFIKKCCQVGIGLPLAASLLQSCGALYYATTTQDAGKTIVAKSEFWEVRKNKKVRRPFVLITVEGLAFPICIYETQEDNYVASLLKCTHRGCELNVGGGIYSCPCHGSEFSASGGLLQGPAERDLKTFKTETDHENIYLYIS